MDYRELVNLGLSEKEAKVYLAALELGKAPVAKIAQKAEVNRATTYVQIKSLMAKGLMSSYEEGKKTYYFAESPEKLSLLFREQAMAIQRKQEYLDKILPELKSLKPLEGDKPTVRYFEGKNGLQSIAEEITSYKKEPMRLMYSQDLIKNIFTEEERALMRKKRIAKNIKTKVIYNYNEGILPNTLDGQRLKVSSKDYPISCDIAIYGQDKVRIATLKNKILGLIIENKEIYETFKSLFDLAWIGAKFLNSKSRNKK